MSAARKIARQMERENGAAAVTGAEEITQLEALGYRTIVEIEQRQAILRQINARIAEIRTGVPLPTSPEPESPPDPAEY